MIKVFLLRFQEECLPDDTLRIHSADPTHTLIKAEAPDESSDCGMTALPFETANVCLTSTCTRTLAETNDTDLGQSGLHAIPKCF